MEQRALKNVNSCLNTNIYSYIEKSGGESYIPHLNVVHFFNTGINLDCAFCNISADVEKNIYRSYLRCPTNPPVYFVV
jgi:hypothetical protein